ncbi:MAG TPA: discoidin domain-containing protein, partial [Nitrososphaeraceae archaeon]|nr:discoidin domain-containing protein [Nitrososphaeraceae archaeon]
MSRLFIRAAIFFFIVASFMISQTIHPTFGQTSNSCADTSIKGLTASGSTQNFPPNNVIDKNFNTVWSYYGKGSWIQLDLGSNKNICAVNIAWYKGDVRQSNFVISTSTDGTSYKNVLSSKSTGNTLSFDKYTIPSTSA